MILMVLHNDSVTLFVTIRFIPITFQHVTLKLILGYPYFHLTFTSVVSPQTYSSFFFDRIASISIFCSDLHLIAIFNFTIQFGYHIQFSIFRNFKIFRFFAVFKKCKNNILYNSIDFVRNCGCRKQSFSIWITTLFRIFLGLGLVLVGTSVLIWDWDRLGCRSKFGVELRSGTIYEKHHIWGLRI